MFPYAFNIYLEIFILVYDFVILIIINKYKVFYI